MHGLVHEERDMRWNETSNILHSYTVYSFEMQKAILLWIRRSSQFLIFQLPFKLFRLGNLPHSLVEVVLVDGIPIILDREESPTTISIFDD